MKEIKKTEFIFNLYFYINVFCKGIGLNNSSSIYFLLLIVGFYLLFMKILNDKFTRKEYLFIFICIFTGIMTFLKTKSPTVLLTMITIAGLKNVKIDKLIKNCLIIRCFTFILMIFLSSVGIIENTQIIMYRMGEISHRYGLGYGHPNITHLNFFIICSMYIYIRFKKINIFELLILSALNIILYSFTVCRTSFITVFLLIILTFFLKNSKSKIIAKLPLIVLAITFLFSVFFAFSYNKINLVNNLDIIFNGRISYSNYYFYKYGISLFGNFLKFDTNAIFDNGYLLILIQFGLATTVIIGYILFKTLLKIQKNIDMRLVVISIPYLVSFFTESYAPNIFMNLLLLIACSELYINNKGRVKFEKENNDIYTNL